MKCSEIWAEHTMILPSNTKSIPFMNLVNSALKSWSAGMHDSETHLACEHQVSIFATLTNFIFQNAHLNALQFWVKVLFMSCYYPLRWHGKNYGNDKVRNNAPELIMKQIHSLL
jgi:hypothetical protein